MCRGWAIIFVPSTIAIYFHQSLVDSKYYAYLCSARTRQASQRCSNVRVVL